jgi:hypothetical protein
VEDKQTGCVVATYTLNGDNNFDDQMEEAKEENNNPLEASPSPS